MCNIQPLLDAAIKQFCSTVYAVGIIIQQIISTAIKRLSSGVSSATNQQLQYLAHIRGWKLAAMQHYMRRRYLALKQRCKDLQP